MPSTLGTPATTIMLQGFSNHFTHVEFEAGAAVYKGQPVKLNNSGEVVPLANGDDPSLNIGVAHADVDSGEMVTVCTRGLGVTNAEANAAVNPGVAKVVGFHSATSRVLIEQATDISDFNGWVLDVASTQYDSVRVLHKM